ncbi:2-5A-dependent ribonuclease-like [Patiria miniata]|uniref:Uncharacterized protein n=1 Tax=Patiria miniata TaxID=46514 RepID=A0A913ZDF1_PATMI|nr:2-5A-dependent ribonuclease-like [Patiria miniata]XP_038049080.1 2-5A-dependent ribonuclease-like [Patiria miniata]XP_038049081.1 2-5A-dependent ribonuclease-like [Patiria miniata]XP_038049082.1 2-5A-dependent ribonuclease-like [Patiria miniata]
MSHWSLRQKLRESVIEAVNRGDLLEVEALLNKGADVNESEGGYLSKRTLLIMAVEKNFSDVARLLINRGADLSATVMVNKRELTVLDIPKEREMTSLVAVIEKKVQANQRLLAAVEEGNSSSVQEAVRNGASINLLHKEGDDSPQMNLLFHALGKGHVDVANTLIRGGIDLHFTVAFSDQTTEDTARSYAERLNQDDIVNLIDQEIKRQEATPDANSCNENSQERQGLAKRQGFSELEDIEDMDFVEHQESNTAGQRKQTQKRPGATCVVC